MEFDKANEFHFQLSRIFTIQTIHANILETWIIVCFLLMVKGERTTNIFIHSIDFQRPNEHQKFNQSPFILTFPPACNDKVPLETKQFVRFSLTMCGTYIHSHKLLWFWSFQQKKFLDVILLLKHQKHMMLSKEKCTTT